MATFELNKENIESSIENNDILLIDFWADWCGPCKMFGPVFEKSSEKHTDVAFAKCNTEKEPEVAGLFGVQSIPTLAVFREKALIFIQPGALPPAALEELITKVRELDMDEVRAKMAEAEAEHAQEHGHDHDHDPDHDHDQVHDHDQPVEASPTSETRPTADAGAEDKAAETLLSPTTEAGEGLSDMAGDFLLRRQGVTKEFLEMVERGSVSGAALEVVSMYDKMRRALRDEGGDEGRTKAKALFAGWNFKPDTELADLSSEIRSEIKAVLRAIEELLRE